MSSTLNAGSGNRHASSSTPSLADQKPGVRNTLDSTRSATAAVKDVPKVDDSQRTIAKRWKRSSPFRIKEGYVVALRYRSGGNRVIPEPLTGISTQTSTPLDAQWDFAEVWTDPRPGRDEGLALIGRRIRCCFPKFVLSESYEKKASSRVVEGEVVGIVGFDGCLQRRDLSRRRREAHGTTVDLLIEKQKLDDMPFLTRVDIDIDPSTLTKSGRRAHENEMTIKGHNKAVVRVIIGDCSGISLKRVEASLEAKWVIRRRFPIECPPGKRKSQKTREIVKGNSTLVYQNSEEATKQHLSESGGATCTPTDDGDQVRVNGGPTAPTSKAKKKESRTQDPACPRYIGDLHDTPTQQQANWRWEAGNLTHLPTLKEVPLGMIISQGLSGGFLGEIVGMKAALASDNTIAFAVIRCLVLPEHTPSGRMYYHGADEVFDVFDSNNQLFRIPVEELVIVSRRLDRLTGVSTDPSRSVNGHNISAGLQSSLFSKMSYSFQCDWFADSTREAAEFERGQNVCSRCRRVSRQIDASEPPFAPHWICEQCNRTISETTTYQISSRCDCSNCDQRSDVELQRRYLSAVDEAREKKPVSEDLEGEETAAFMATRLTAKQMSNTDFGIVHETFWKVTPSLKPIVKQKPRGTRKKRTPNSTATSDAAVQATGTTSSNQQAINEVNQVRVEKQSFRPTCARQAPYNARKRRYEEELGEHEISPRCGSRDVPRNLRMTHWQAEKVDNDKDDTTSSRAIRANQRRFVRDVAAIGVNLDTLVGREQNLRFDRSGIHAWGVFADEELKEGDLLVEYRGEIIGNILAEKREQEYESAKIGSDYMFRIDTNTVCDATKQGNVARFINHSCDANCVTKVISTDGTKRIVVYAKRDIQAGEELCYDYKFPLEYDETKRIPCKCGSHECRGFMNWDKRYVALQAGPTSVL